MISSVLGVTIVTNLFCCISKIFPSEEPVQYNQLPWMTGCGPETKLGNNPLKEKDWPHRYRKNEEDDCLYGF